MYRTLNSWNLLPRERVSSLLLSTITIKWMRAHIQHLHAFATKDKKLRNKLVDPRYKYVQPRGKAPTVWKLAGTWAMDKNYGNKLDALLKELEKY